MNFHLQSKFDIINRKVEVEKLYEDIKEKEKQRKIIVSEDDVLKSELERYGVKVLRPMKNPLNKVSMR